MKISTNQPEPLLVSYHAPLFAMHWTFTAVSWVLADEEHLIDTTYNILLFGFYQHLSVVFAFLFMFTILVINFMVYFVMFRGFL